MPVFSAWAHAPAGIFWLMAISTLHNATILCHLLRFGNILCARGVIALYGESPIGWQLTHLGLSKTTPNFSNALTDAMRNALYS
jgi:hypothetical protein